MNREPVTDPLEVTADDIALARRMLEKLVPSLLQLVPAQPKWRSVLEKAILADFDFYLEPALTADRGPVVANQQELASYGGFSDEYLPDHVTKLTDVVETLAIGIITVLAAAGSWLEPAIWRMATWTSEHGRAAKQPACVGKKQTQLGPALAGPDATLPANLIVPNNMTTATLSAFVGSSIDRVHRAVSEISEGLGKALADGDRFPLSTVRGDTIDRWFSESAPWVVPALEVGEQKSFALAPMYADPTAIVEAVKSLRPALVVEIKPRTVLESELIDRAQFKSVWADANKVGFDIESTLSSARYYLSPRAHAGYDVLTRILNLTKPTDGLGEHTSFVLIDGEGHGPMASFENNLGLAVACVEVLGSNQCVIDCITRFGRKHAPSMVRGRRAEVRRLIALFRVISNAAVVASSRSRMRATRSRRMSGQHAQEA